MVTGWSIRRAGRLSFGLANVTTCGAFEPTLRRVSRVVTVRVATRSAPLGSIPVVWSRGSPRPAFRSAGSMTCRPAWCFLDQYLSFGVPALAGSGGFALFGGRRCSRRWSTVGMCPVVTTCTRDAGLASLRLLFSAARDVAGQSDAATRMQDAATQTFSTVPTSLCDAGFNASHESKRRSPPSSEHRTTGIDPGSTAQVEAS